MCGVVSELSKFFVYGANRWGVRSIDWVFLGVVPIPIPVRTCSEVVNKDVVGMRDPETSWGLVSIE